MEVVVPPPGHQPLGGLACTIIFACAVLRHDRGRPQRHHGLHIRGDHRRASPLRGYVSVPLRWTWGRHDAQCIAWEEQYPVPSSASKEPPSRHTRDARACPRCHWVNALLHRGRSHSGEAGSSLSRIDGFHRTCSIRKARAADTGITRAKGTAGIAACSSTSACRTSPVKRDPGPRSGSHIRLLTRWLGTAARLHSPSTAPRGASPTRRTAPLLHAMSQRTRGLAQVIPLTSRVVRKVPVSTREAPHPGEDGAVL